MRPRHQLHRGRRGAGRDRPSCGGPPVPRMNLVGDYGGGGIDAPSGWRAHSSRRGNQGKGQVVDATMTDGAAVTSTSLHWMRAAQGRGTRRAEPTGSTRARTSTTCTRPPMAVTSASARLSRSSTPSYGGFLASPARSGTGRTTARPGRELKKELAAVFAAKTRDSGAARVRRGGGRRVLLPVLSPGEALNGSAQRGPRDVPDQGRSHLPRAGPEAVAHPRGRGRASASARPGHGRGAAGLGLR